MKKYLLIHIIFLLSIMCHAQQDTIYLSPTEKTLGKVKEISSEQVKVEKKNGALYLLDIDDVFRIVYSDGEVEMLIKKREDEYFKNKQYTENFGRNIVAVNFFHILRKGLELHYEHFLLEGDMSLKPYGSIFLDDRSVSMSSQQYAKDYSFGLAVHYYPTGQGRIKYFLGPGFEYGGFETVTHTRYPNSPQVSIREVKEFNFYYAYLNNGVLFQPSPKLSIGLILSLGLRENIGLGSANSHAEFRANFGYRF